MKTRLGGQTCCSVLTFAFCKTIQNLGQFSAKRHKIMHFMFNDLRVAQKLSSFSLKKYNTYKIGPRKFEAILLYLLSSILKMRLSVSNIGTTRVNRVEALSQGHWSRVKQE